MNLTRDIVMEVSTKEDEKHRRRDKTRDYSKITIIVDYEKYHELVKRPTDWSEAKANLGTAMNCNMEPLG
jgi:hypothetical protein